MSLYTKFLKFCNRNVVLLTCIPLIGSVHWAWLKIQDIPYLVPPEDKLEEMPIITIAKKLGNKFSEEYLSSGQKGQSNPAQK